LTKLTYILFVEFVKLELYLFADNVGRSSQPVFPWHSLLPFLHVTADRSTPPRTEVNDHSGNFFHIFSRSYLILVALLILFAMKCRLPSSMTLNVYMLELSAKFALSYFKHILHVAAQVKTSQMCLVELLTHSLGGGAVARNNYIS